MSRVCVGCQREGGWRKLAVLHDHYGLMFCELHDRAYRADIDLLASLPGKDPQREHGVIDDVLLKWAPVDLAEHVESAISRQRWWATA